jgi:hypothetical protein
MTPAKQPRAGRSPPARPAARPAAPHRPRRPPTHGFRQSPCACGGACPRCADERIASGGHRDGALRSSGQPLDGATRDRMSARFGVDLAGVRVHADGPAAAAAAALGAAAFAVGADVAFAAGRYAPQTEPGRRLLAHELAHVVQQSRTAPPAPDAGLAVNRDAGLEREADRAADAVLAGASPGRLATLAGPALQLEEAGKPAAPAAEDVWGFRVHAGMCGCFDLIAADLAEAEQAIADYKACDKPENPTAVDVFTCVDPGYPDSSQGLTGPGGTSRLPPESDDPCQRLHNKNVAAHEARHGQQAISLAQQFGPNFVKAFRRLQGDPEFEAKMWAGFPAQMADYVERWNDGHNAAQREVGAYRFNMQFLYAARAALNRICRM